MELNELNWYKTSRITDALYSEASFREWMNAGILGALVSILSGVYTNTAEAAQKHNVPEKQLQEALANKNLIDRVQKVIENQRNQKYERNPLLPNSFYGNEPAKPAKPVETKETKEILTKEQQRIVDVLSRTLWGEAAGENLSGQKAVLSVILNRAGNNPQNIIKVIKAPKQFSCWNNGTPNKGYGPIWDKIVEISKEAVLGKFTPNLPYVSYFNPDLANPDWAYANGKLVTPNAQIGNHIFLNPKNLKPSRRKS